MFCPYIILFSILHIGQKYFLFLMFKHNYNHHLAGEQSFKNILHTVKTVALPLAEQITSQDVHLTDIYILNFFPVTCLPDGFNNLKKPAASIFRADTTSTHSQEHPSKCWYPPATLWCHNPENSNLNLPIIFKVVYTINDNWKNM